VNFSSIGAKISFSKYILDHIYADIRGYPLDESLCSFSGMLHVLQMFFAPSSLTLPWTSIFFEDFINLFPNQFSFSFAYMLI
jgi:hypothetical protein